MRRNNMRSALVHSAICSFALVLMLFVPISSAFGSKVGKEVGSPTGSYPMSDLDTVSLFSGNLNFNLPFLSVGSRGDAGIPLSLNVQRQWSEWRYIYNITYSYSPYTYDPPTFLSSDCQMYYDWLELGYMYKLFCTQVPGTFSTVHITEVVFHNPIPQTSMNPVKPGYGPGILKGKTRVYATQGCRYYDPTVNGYNSQALAGRPLSTTAYLVFTEPDGTEHQFVDKDTGGSMLTFPTPMCDAPELKPRGLTWVSVEDSSETFVADAVLPEMMGTVDQYGGESYYGPTGYLLRKDGRRFRIEGGLVKWIRDRNGNRTDFVYDESNKRVTTITDSLGRQTSIDYDVNDTTISPDGTAYGLCDQIHFNGVNGTARTIRITKTMLTNALRSGFTPKTTSQLWPNLGSYGNNTSPISNQIQIVSALWLPDGRAYKFSYNSFGELARVELPAGGAIEYDHDYTINWTDGGGTTYHNFFPTGPFLRRVAERREYSDKTDPASLTKKTTFSNIYPNGYSGGTVTPQPITVDQKDKNDVLLSRTKHYFIGHPMNINRTNTLVQAPPWDNGLESSTETIDTTDGTTVLQRVERSWTPRVLGTGTAETLDPNLTETKTSLLSADTTIVSKQTFNYDSFNNLTDTLDYDFGLGTPPAYAVRKTHTDYVSTTDYTDAGGPHIRNLPKAQQIYSINPQTGAETLVAQSEMKYDETLLDPLYGSVQGWADPGSVRGNLTKVRRWLNTTGIWVETRKEYDQVGNVSKAYDELNNMSEIKYSATYHRAYPTETISAVPDPAGVTGSNTSLTTATAYDFSTGLPVQETDNNTQNTNYSYVDDNNVADPLDRLRTVTRPAGGGSTKYEYGDTPGNIFVKVRSEIDPGLFKEGITFYDGLGRAVKIQSQDAQGDVFTETVYDGLGRTSKTSAPYRSGDQKQWTETVYDGLGRTKEVISPKIANEATPAKMTIDYSVSQYGVVHVNTNQAGRKVRSIRNALDQVVRVDEPTFDTNDLGAIDNPIQSTSYKYDALGNLLRVLQGSQSRFFLYDSLGRLLRSREVEQDVNSSLAVTDPLTNNGQWSSGFTYDAKGNPLTITDAKGAVTTISYDKLNRVYQRTYSIPQTSDPKKITVATSTVSFKYDGLLSPSPNDPTPAVVALAKGAVTEVSNNSSMTQFTSFDAVGHIRGSRQITDGQVYPFSYEYNLAGSLKSEVYPSGRTVTNGFDNTGDLSLVSSNLPSQSAITYASDFHHLPDGTMDQVRLGNGRWETSKTNTRQQITQIALGISATDTSLWKVDYDYGLLNQDGSVDVSKNDGSVAKQTITVPGVTTPYVQTYKYDYLSRLQEATETTGTNQNWKQTFAYDRYGNRNGFTYNINGSPVSLNSTNNPAIDSSTNRISAGQGYDHDFNGNVIQDALGRKFGFDADNRQRTVSDTGSQIIATYDYDGSGQRIKKTNAAGQQTVFVYDATGRLVAEYSNENAGASGRTYVTADILNSPRVISNSAGDVTSRRDFMPFGESIAVARSVNQKYGVNDGLRQNFTAKERDTETGLDYFGARYYSSQSGRFTGIDPAGPDPVKPQTFNRYVYCLNNPLRFIDKDGRYEQDVHEDLTRVLAYAVGFTMEAATKIGKATQAPDNPGDPRNPYESWKSREQYHFVTPERLSQLGTSFFVSNGGEYRTYVSWNYGENLINQMGEYLHALQDSYSHQGYGPWLGQGIDYLKGKDPYAADRTATAPGKADEMALQTFKVLLQAKTGWVGNSVTVNANSISYYALKPLIARFNKATSADEKRKILDEMVKKIDQFRRLSASPTPTTTMRTTTQRNR